MDRMWARIKLAFAAFFTILFKGRAPARLQELGGAAPVTAAPRDTQSDRAAQMLALLQRDGRLVDFLMEDLATYSDAQIGAAVRDVQAGCRRVLERHLTFESILSGGEGKPITVDSDIDPAAVRLVGNVTARPPFSGTLLHRGWRIARMALPPLADPDARMIVAQAEIEVG